MSKAYQKQLHRGVMNGNEMSAARRVHYLERQLEQNANWLRWEVGRESMENPAYVENRIEHEALTELLKEETK